MGNNFYNKIDNLWLTPVVCCLSIYTIYTYSPSFYSDASRGNNTDTDNITTPYLMLRFLQSPTQPIHPSTHQYCPGRLSRAFQCYTGVFHLWVFLAHLLFDPSLSIHTLFARCPDPHCPACFGSPHLSDAYKQPQPPHAHTSGWCAP